jgi:hypothetical protein
MPHCCGSRRQHPEPSMTNWGRQRTAATATIAGMSGQLGQVTLDVAEGEALAGLLGEVDDVGRQPARRPRSRARVDCRPPTGEVVENYVCAVGKCKTD